MALIFFFFFNRPQNGEQLYPLMFDLRIRRWPPPGESLMKVVGRGGWKEKGKRKAELKTQKRMGSNVSHHGGEHSFLGIEFLNVQAIYGRLLSLGHTEI